MPPLTRYAVADGVHIAYQTIGDGPRDLLFVPGFVSNVEHWWDEPAATRFFERLAAFSRVILFDKRGTGLSDRVADVAVLERRVDDLTVVLDAVGAGHAVVVGASEAGPTCAVFAATHPERVSALVLVGAMARWTSAPDYPWARSALTYKMVMRTMQASWGTGITMPLYAPSRWADAGLRSWWARLERTGAGPGALHALLEANMNLDVRPVLPSIRVPTLVLHSVGDRAVKIGGSRYIASVIPDAKFVQLPGSDHVFFGSDSDALLVEIQEFVTGVRPPPGADRVLATVLFADLVGSTELLARIGDERWRSLLAEFRRLVRTELGRSGGREIDNPGDGFLASFDGPARAVRCALAIRAALGSIDLSVRQGLHTGEVEIVGAKLEGLAVHLGARVAGAASGGEILVSSTVKDLVAGSGLRFTDRGTHQLKGVPDEWHLYAVATM
ncbi:MAG TPA: adenylate/guanylate cyclase domain-containing protein [Candidatus Saccharimonadales bacterium]|nr:adenylate/guanylate cyclase domain-containing protein [Candidatus Saccharimonadales bacterium]